eukprot:5102820-Lingulodinium_polyedra.AAC.1
MAETANPCVANCPATNRAACDLNASPERFKLKPARQSCPGAASYACKTSCEAITRARVNPGMATTPAGSDACGAGGSKSLRRTSS